MMKVVLKREGYEAKAAFDGSEGIETARSFLHLALYTPKNISLGTVGNAATTLAFGTFGLGIGLTVEKKLVEMHGGSITAESAGGPARGASSRSGCPKRKYCRGSWRPRKA